MTAWTLTSADNEQVRRILGRYIHKESQIYQQFTVMTYHFSHNYELCQLWDGTNIICAMALQHDDYTTTCKAIHVAEHYRQQGYSQYMLQLAQRKYSFVIIPQDELTAMGNNFLKGS